MGVTHGLYVAEYRDLDEDGATVTVRYTSNSIRSAAKYAARTTPDGYHLEKVTAL